MIPQGRLRTDKAAHRRAVMKALGSGPRTGHDLTNSLAARCGTKRHVSAAVEALKLKGWIRGVPKSRQEVTWHLTQAGITEAMRMIAERQGAAS